MSELMGFGVFWSSWNSRLWQFWPS